MLIEIHGMDDESNFTKALSFHRRRHVEMRQYDMALHRITSRMASKKDKLHLSYERLFRQPMAYQTLVAVWVASPYANGATSWDGWDCVQTAYSVASELSPNGKLPATLNYVTRVIEAAVAYELIERDPVAANRILLRGTIWLHRLMTEFASACLKENNRGP